MKKNKLLIITPIYNLKYFLNKANKIFKTSYKPEISVNNFRKIIGNFDYVFTNPNKTKIYFNHRNLQNCNLRAVCTASTGTTHIDKAYLKSNNIKLISITKEKKILRKLSSTSELAFALTLDAVRNVSNSSNAVKKYNWDYEPHIGRMMSGLKILVIGYGRLGKIYSKFALAFGCEVYVYDPYLKINNSKIKIVKNLNDIISFVDIISLHIHAEKENYNFLNHKNLKLMKKDIIIINTSRGEIINEKDLLIFLKKNQRAKYYTDVLTDEINFKKNKLIKFSQKNNQIIITPHIGGMTIDGQNIAYNHALDMLIKYHEKISTR